MSEVFDAGLVLNGLKDFQRRTVDYVFARMFDPSSPTTRFLVADEVGLGKTLVAKGVIAKTVEHMQRLGQKQVSVVYVCSNAGIAAQNVERLSLPGQSAYVESTRLTLLPLKTVQLKEHPVSFISFTPGTTFNQGAKRGRKDERRLIYQMLRELPGVSRVGLMRAMKGTAGEEGWALEAEWAQVFDEAIAAEYRNRVATDHELIQKLMSVCNAYADDDRRPWSEQETEGGHLTAELRRVLAKVCLSTLKPDLVILDEFQRFRELFEDVENNPAAELANALFNYAENTRVLLLSATPYKMYASDQEDEDHHGDFLRTVKFLKRDDQASMLALQDDLRDFRTDLLAVTSTDLDRLSALKARIESSLRAVMCRTERVGTTRLADAMVKECLITPELRPRDLKDFRWLEAVADKLQESGTLEYWKSSPYLLNFMKEYSHKRSLRSDQELSKSAIADLLSNSADRLLSPQDIDAYRAIDAANPKVRSLLNELDAQGLWRLLWMPASMPYWRPQGAFENVGSVTKHLIFSAWNVVPDAIASILSYEVERRIVEESGTSPTYSHKSTARLRFARQQDGRLGGMFTLMLQFPSVALLQIVDPLELRMEGGGPCCDFTELRLRAARKLAPHLESIVVQAPLEGHYDRRWYWVALAQLERTLNPSSRTWCAQKWSHARVGDGNADAEVEGEHEDPRTAFNDHVELWLKAWDAPLEGLGRVPEDLAEVLATVALAGPANCALRALTRQWPMTADLSTALLNAAARIAEGMRSQFNSPRANWLLAGQSDEDSYWERVLQYSADGNLQAVLDEHTHVLVESKALTREPPARAAEKLAQAMFEALSLRTASLHPDELRLEGDRLKVASFSTGIRTHFALRYGGRTDDEGTNTRKETVQAAFNSPFWPFVLVSTSVGQESLDFHTWCHSVIHWNLPSNPVDLEQREGRVHRYKGYAVRKNVAAVYGEVAMQQQSTSAVQDPWKECFGKALSERPTQFSDLVPFWIFEHPGGASIERRVMPLPLSRDEAKYRRLRRSLALYRMVFVQPRQEDLLACLERTIDPDQAMAISARWSINLSPPRLGDEDCAPA